MGDGLAGALKVASHDAMVARVEAKLDHVTHLRSDLGRVEGQTVPTHRDRDGGCRGMRDEAGKEEDGVC